MVAAGESLFILGTHGRENCDELVLDLMSRVDGLIIMGRTVTDEVVRALEGGRTPIALLARPPVDDIPSVRSRGPRPGRRADRAPARARAHAARVRRRPGVLAGRRGALAGLRPGARRGRRRAVRGRVRRGRGPPGRRPRARLGRHRAPVRQRRDRARRLPRRPLTRAAHPRGHCHHRVGRHPARAVRLPSPDHRAPADARARRRHREAPVRAHRGRRARGAVLASGVVIRASCGCEPPSEEEEST